MTVKLTEEQLAKLIPEDCKVNWNKQQNCYYVFKSKYVYDPKIKRSREIRESVGSVTNGVFRYSKSFLMKQELEEYKKHAEVGTENASEKISQTVAEEITDTRQQGKVKYPLDYVFLVALLSSLSGQTNCVQIADYWKNNRPAFESLFEDFPKHDISHDTVRRLLMLIDPSQFQCFYRKLIQPLIHQFNSRVIAVDGQAIRASKTPKLKTGKYILTFYDTDNGLCLSQQLIGEKENEITHAADMVEGLDLAGTVVTADALNTQERFARTLIERKADYCLAVKENHKKLYLDIQLAFLDRQETRTLKMDRLELGHGRIDNRSISVLPAQILDEKHLNKWEGLDQGCLIKATTETIDKQTGNNSCLDRYFITTLSWDNERIVEQCARAVRRHWGIENDLHYVLDVDFYQDRTQCKNANYLQNRVLLNKLALAAIRRCQRHEEEKTGKNAASVKRYMSKFTSLPESLAVISLLFN